MKDDTNFEDYASALTAAIILGSMKQKNADEEMRTAIKEMRKFVDMMTEEGFTRKEAIDMIVKMSRPAI